MAQNYLIACLARCSKERGGSGSALFSRIGKFFAGKGKDATSYRSDPPTPLSRLESWPTDLLFLQVQQEPQ